VRSKMRPLAQGTGVLIVKKNKTVRASEAELVAGLAVAWLARDQLDDNIY
jgi:hypothetical protein